MNKAKDFVSSGLAQDVGEKPAKVVCPDAVKAEKGKSFECTAEFGTVKATVGLTQDDDQGNVTVTSVKGIIVSKKAEAVLADQLGQRFNAHFTVDCGPRVRAATPGDTFTCTAKDGEGKGGPVTVTIKDAEGNVRFELGEPGAPAAEPAPAAEQAPAAEPAE